MSNENTSVETTENQNTSTETNMSDVNQDQVVEEQMNKEADVPKTPAWQTFTAAVQAKAESLGLKVKEQAGFVQYLNAETGHKLYVAKGGKEVKRIDTTLDLIGFIDGAHKPEKPNGRIASQIRPDVESLSAALELLADASVGKIRPPARQKKAATETAAPASETPAAE